MYVDGGALFVGPIAREFPRLLSAEIGENSGFDSGFHALCRFHPACSLSLQVFGLGVQGLLRGGKVKGLGSGSQCCGRCILLRFFL